MKSLFTTSFVLFSALTATTALADERYFLCGPDEDGCFPSIYKYCLCIPYNEAKALQPYCLTFDTLGCKPLSENPNCEGGIVFPDQSSCVASEFQSEPKPPCPIKSKKFCMEHKIPTCDLDAPTSTCKVRG